MDSAGTQFQYEHVTVVEDDPHGNRTRAYVLSPELDGRGPGTPIGTLDVIKAQRFAFVAFVNGDHFNLVRLRREDGSSSTAVLTYDECPQVFREHVEGIYAPSVTASVSSADGAAAEVLDSSDDDA